MAGYVPYASPEDAALAEEDRLRSYYSAQPVASVQPPATAPVEDPAAAYYGPPPPPPPVPGLDPDSPEAWDQAQRELAAKTGVQLAPNASAGATPFERSNPNSPAAQAAAMAPGAQAVSTPASPPAPIGPSARDNAEYADYLASQAKPKAMSGGGASRPANPDPYGQKAATDRLLGTFDEAKNATQAEGWASAAKSLAVSDKQMELAKRRQEDAEIDAAERDEFAKQYDSQMGELQAQLDDVRSKKIQPMTHMEAAGNLGALGFIAAAISGFSEGLHGRGGNPYIEHLDRIIDRQIAVDEKNIDNEKQVAGQRMNLLAQQRTVFNDRTQAKMAARQLYYESFKDEIASEAAKYDAPIYTANAEKAIAAIDQQQAQLQKELADQVARRAQAAASANFAHAKEVRDFRRDVYDKVLSSTGSPELAETEANRQVALVYAPGVLAPRQPGQTVMGGSPLARVPKDLRSEASKELSAHATAEKGISNLNSLFRQWDQTGVTNPRQLDSIKGTISSVYKGALGPGMSSDKDFETFIAPNVPAVGDSAETLAMKRKNIESTIRSKVATPILDQTTPGWRPPTTQESAAALGAKPHGR